MLRQLPTSEDPNVLVGTAVPADAGVYRLSDDVALVQSVDLFTPVVDDPFDYGRIAAANSLSDLYAMGATPRTALNVVSFPKGLPTEILVEMLRGGAEVAREAGVAILGGHTVQGPEPMYGLAVTGVVHPQRLVSNQGAQPGDLLVLTKPLGLGILTTAHKRGMLPDDVLREAVEVMATLNRAAAEAMTAVGVHAATDITGYGLLGHLHELLAASGAAARIVAERVPVLEAAWTFAAQNVVPGGSQSTFGYLTDEIQAVTWDAALTWEQQIVLCDAQTSGGLLIAVPPERVEALLAALEARGVATRALIGEVVAGAPGHIDVTAHE
ncbi:segregation protein A [Ardenticatena maritima]|uniref:Selenide, water dikinase n=1 Tax=Ardenticatena maritima TaxID=872965 RepID=A0A0P6Y7W0_9CHLR|nr:segregation protein A [Ardenticatena maritima]